MSSINASGNMINSVLGLAHKQANSIMRIASNVVNHKLSQRYCMVNINLTELKVITLKTNLVK